MFASILADVFLFPVLRERSSSGNKLARPAGPGDLQRCWVHVNDGGCCRGCEFALILQRLHGYFDFAVPNRLDGAYVLVDRLLECGVCRKANRLSPAVK